MPCCDCDDFLDRFRFRSPLKTPLEDVRCEQATGSSYHQKRSMSSWPTTRTRRTTRTAYYMGYMGYKHYNYIQLQGLQGLQGQGHTRWHMDCASCDCVRCWNNLFGFKSTLCLLHWFTQQTKGSSDQVANVRWFQPHQHAVRLSKSHACYTGGSGANTTSELAESWAVATSNIGGCSSDCAHLEQWTLRGLTSKRMIQHGRSTWTRSWVMW